MTDPISMEQAFADRLEPEILQFEANAALWRLEADRHLHRLLEDQAIGLDGTQHRAGAQVALEGIGFEIDRFEAFTRRTPGLPLDLLIRLAEVAMALETIRRKLTRALHPSSGRESA